MVLYYITDYITKTQLTVHVAYVALNLAVHKLGEPDDAEDNYKSRAKHLLQKCAYSMLSHQELSGQQVTSYLQGFSDHFTSHRYSTFSWTALKRYLDHLDPSPKCYTSSAHNTENNEENIPTDASNLNVTDVDPQPDPDHLVSDDKHSTLIDDEPEDQVAVDVSPHGSLIMKGNFVSNYVCCGKLFSELTVWDFVCRVQKKRRMCKADETGTLSCTEDSQDNTHFKVLLKMLSKQFRIFCPASHASICVVNCYNPIQRRKPTIFNFNYLTAQVFRYQLVRPCLAVTGNHKLLNIVA